MVVILALKFRFLRPLLSIDLQFSNRGTVYQKENCTTERRANECTGAFTMCLIKFMCVWYFIMKWHDSIHFYAFNLSVCCRSSAPKNCSVNNLDLRLCKNRANLPNLGSQRRTWSSQSNNCSELAQWDLFSVCAECKMQRGHPPRRYLTLLCLVTFQRYKQQVIPSSRRLFVKIFAGTPRA